MSKLVVTGIDVGTKDIKAAVIIHNGQRFALASLLRIPVTNPLLSANYLFNYQEIVKKLQAIKRSLPRFSKKVAISVPDTAVLDGLFHIDAGLEGGEREFAIEQAIASESPLPVQDLALDYCRVSTGTSASADAYYFCATRSVLADNRIEAFKRAGLRPVMLEAENRSLLHILDLVQAGNSQEKDFLLYAGESDITLCGQLRGGVPFVRTITSEPAVNSEPFRSAEGGRSCFRQIVSQIHLLASAPDYLPPKQIWFAGDAFSEEPLLQELTDQLGVPVSRVNLPALLPGKGWSEEERPELFTKSAGLAISGIRWLREGYEY